MILIQIIASFIAVVACSVAIVEVPKKYLVLVGIIGAIAWGSYLLCKFLNLPDILSYFISSLVVAILSIILSKILKVVSTMFLIPGILPTVPGVSMYKMVYGLINNNTQEATYYLMQAIFIAAGIALAIFITESIKGIRILKRGELDENKV